MNFKNPKKHDERLDKLLAAIETMKLEIEESDRLLDLTIKESENLIAELKQAS